MTVRIMDNENQITPSAFSHETIVDSVVREYVTTLTPLKTRVNPTIFKKINQNVLIFMILLYLLMIYNSKLFNLPKFIIACLCGRLLQSSD